jgi:hypothetical protein
MPDNDKRDPLDGWLNQQVQPLPPPPGTFELITRRARRRKVRKLAVTIASAAAVAAAVVVAVPGGLLLHVNSSPSANGEAVGRTQPIPSRRSSPKPTGAGSRYPSAAPKPSSTSSQSTQPAATGPVPANFQPSSITFVDTDHAWVIGQAGTPGHCADANPDFCTSIAYTDDAGQTWQGGPAPQTGPADGATGVSGIRFLDGVNGWAFGPELWVTHDGGSTWYEIPTDGQRVTDLETVNGRAYALWATCSGTSTAGFAAACTSFTLMTTTADSDNWVPVGAATTGLTDGGNPTSALISLTGSAGYLVAPDGTLYSGPIGGSWQKAGTLPCQPGTPQASGQPAGALFGVLNPTLMAVACSSGPAAASRPVIWESGNSGATWTRLPSPAPSATANYPAGAITSLTGTLSGTLMLATTKGIYVYPGSGSQWTTVTSASGQNAPAGGFTYVGMTTSTQGVALPADESLHEIWMTFNGGQTWAPRTPITPGN